MQYKDGALNK